MSTTITAPWVYSPGEAITAVASATVTVRHLVAISGDRSGGNLSVAPAADGGRVFGVAAGGAAAGELVRVARGGVAKVVASGAISAGDAVQAAAGGAVSTAAAGVVIGLAVADAADGELAEIAF